MNTNCLSALIGAFRMRRLHQAIILVVATTSLLAVLVYKHEYDRLNNLLHVLNTFGGGGDCTGGGLEAAALRRRQDDSASFFGRWQQFGDVHVYSAFGDSRSGTVHLVGLVETPVVKREPAVSCLLWFDGHPHRRPGRLETTLLSDAGQGNWQAASFVCSPLPSENVDASRLPYAVSLGSYSQTSDNDTPSMVYVRGPSLQPNETEFVRLCVPIHSPWAEIKLLSQFISFHSYLGVSHFTLYDFGTAPEVRRQLSFLKKKLGASATVELLPWNFPNAPQARSHLALSLLKRDCLVRHSDVPFVLFLDVHQVLVPKLHSHLTNLLRDENDLSERALGRIQLTNRVFCTEERDEPFIKLTDASLYPIFLKTKWIDDVIRNSSSIAGNSFAELLAPRAVDVFAPGNRLTLRSGFSDHIFSKDMAVMHSYENCSAYAYERKNFDNSLVRKFGDLMLN